MVDISGKDATKRTAIARARVILGREAFDMVTNNTMAKGDVLTVAKIAGIQASKHTALLIPLCHNISLSNVDVALHLDPTHHAVDIEASAHTLDRTGVEMEAMVAASVSALTVYDMCKAVAKGAIISDLRLIYKSGGKSGIYDVR